jgi:hypothetical protein
VRTCEREEEEEWGGQGTSARIVETQVDRIVEIAHLQGGEVDRACGGWAGRERVAAGSPGRDHRQQYKAGPPEIS